MKRNLLLLAVMVVSLLWVFLQVSGAQQPKTEKAEIPSVAATAAEKPEHEVPSVVTTKPGTIKNPIHEESEVPLDGSPVLLTGDDCTEPIVVNLPAQLPYSDLNQTTCDRDNAYNATCLGSYDGGEDIIYELTVSSTVRVNITLDPKGTTYTGICIDDVCPPGDPCMAYDRGSSGTRSLTGIHLDPGTYYIMIDTWPSPDCIPEFDLTITEADAPPDNDECTGAPVISSFPQTVFGTTIGATIDCPGVLDWYAVWYQFDLPYDCNDLSIDFCPTTDSIWTVGVVVYDECPPDCPGYILATGYQWVTCPSGYDNPQIWWDNLPGGSYWFPVYILDENSNPFMDFAFEVSVEECVPCDVVCPPGGIAEDEPWCEDNWEDIWNGGCTSDPYVFEDVNCGDTICGTSGTYLYYGDNYRDTDWFRVEVAAGILTFTCVAEFPLQTMLIDAGSEDCIDYTILDWRQVDPCDTATISMWVPQGDYWLWIGPSVFEGTHCGGEYVAGLKTWVSYLRGDANGDGKIDIADAVCLINYIFIDGPAPVPLEAGDVNSDGVVDIADVVYLINYLFLDGPPPCEGKVTTSLRGELELHKGKAQAQIGFSSPSIPKDGIFEVPVIGEFEVDLAAVQLEIKYDPEEITLLDPALTPRTEGLAIYSSSNQGIQKIDSLRSLQVGILDLSAKHYISAGTGALVNLRMKGSNLSSRFASLTTSLEITKAILVDRDAQKIPVEIVSEMKKSEEVLIAGKSAVPQEFSLSQNYPNPFNPETKISYSLPTDCHVKLSIYNIAGQKVKTLVDEHQTAGYKTIHWNGKDDQGKKTASGIYFYKMQAGDFSQSRKMVLVK